MKIKKINIETLTVGYLEANCYLIYDSLKNAFIIDPGGETEEILTEIKKCSLNPVGIINTHGHYDHIGANSEIKKYYKIPLYIHKDDAKYLREANLNGSVFFGLKEKSPEADIILENGTVIKYGEMSFEVIHTPGHTPGGICLLTNGVLFTGDTLFRGAVGRWDLPGGNEKALMKSLQVLKSLPKDIKIFPGHGEPSTIGEEIASNPYLSQADSI